MEKFIFGTLAEVLECGSSAKLETGETVYDFFGCCDIQAGAKIVALLNDGRHFVINSSLYPGQ